VDPIQILSALGSLALIVGIGIGVLQLRSIRTQRQEELVIRAYAPFLDTELTRAYWRVQAWTFATFEAFATVATVEDWTTLDQVATYFEMMGVLYKRGHASLDLLDDLFAGSVLVSWRKLAPLIGGYRLREGTPDYAQWFEHLARALDARLTELGEVHPRLGPPGPAPSPPSAGSGTGSPMAAQPSRRATPADLPRLTETIGLAFADDPVWGLAFSRAGAHGAAAIWRIWIEGAMRYPWVWMTDAAEAVSIWIPPGGTELSDEQETAFTDAAIEALGPTGAAYLADVMARFRAAHPHAEPHYYLSLLGTHPAHRGHRIGMKLLVDNLALIDREGSPAYLESSNPANNARYARHGFEPHGEFSLPDNGPVVTTMWRPGRRRDRD
jgi:GNAT superfamily N-acetyltransferase